MTKPNAQSDDIGPCYCQAFTVVETGEHTGCKAETPRNFAPGHDAKLKSLLIRAGVEGHTVARLGLGEMGPVEAAQGFGFADMVATAIEGRKAKKVAVANRKATRELERILAASTPAKIVEATETPKKGQGTTFRAEYQGKTATRTSKTRAYTHAAVYRFGDDVEIGSWHSSETLAAKGTNGLRPVAVVAVTIVK